MIDAALKALGQLSDPPIRRILWKTFFWTILAFILLVILAWYLVGWLSGLHGWWGEIAQWSGILVALILAWFTFPAVAASIASIYSEEVALAVEAKYYPGRGKANEVPVIASVLDGLKLAGLSLLINLVALPFLLVPPLYPVISWGLGGYLIGREYYEMAAYRRLDRAPAHLLFAQHRAKFTLAGILIAVTLTIPILNLIAPVIAVAFMVHLAESVVNQRAIRSI